MQLKPRRLWWVVLVALFSAQALSRPCPAQRVPSVAADNLLLGNPDGATGDSENRDHYLLRRRQYALSYNNSWRFPNWVAWHLQASDIGSVERGQFRPDPALPDGFYRVTPSDYTGSGYDRGHNCPSKDRSATREDNDATFYMTNVSPQQHGMNAGPWNSFEEYCRNLTAEGNELYIYCGHGFRDATYGFGKGGVAVPEFGWKVALVLPEREGDDLARVTADTRVIAVRMPNISTIAKEDWRRFKVSVAEVEQATGLKFFTRLPPAVAERLKNRVDFEPDADPRRGRRPTRGDEPPQGGGKPAVAPASDTLGKVWVNTRSGVYWMPGSQFYGKTKQGKYMSEEEAKKAGYRKAGGQ